MMMTGLELIQQYEAKKVAAQAEIKRLQYQIDDIGYELEDSKPDLSEYIAAQQKVVQEKRDAFWYELERATMEEGFVREYQMRATAAWSTVLPTAHDALIVVNTKDGAAAVAYCLTGQLDRKAVATILPAPSNGMMISQTGSPDFLLSTPSRRKAIEKMCETLGVCTKQLRELTQEEATLNSLKDF